MNSCSLRALRTPCRVQSTSALERDRLVFGRSCDHRFKWSVGLNEGDHIMGRIDQYHWDFSPLFQLLLFDFHLPLPSATFDYLSAIRGSNAASQCSIGSTSSAPCSRVGVVAQRHAFTHHSNTIVGRSNAESDLKVGVSILCCKRAWEGCECNAYI